MALNKLFKTNVIFHIISTLSKYYLIQEDKQFKSVKNAIENNLKEQKKPGETDRIRDV